MDSEFIQFYESNSAKIDKAYSNLTDFQNDYTLDFIRSMDLDAYCIGKSNLASFSHALDKATDSLWSIQSWSNYKFGVFFCKTNDDYKYLDIYENEDTALDTMKKYIIACIKEENKEEPGFSQAILDTDTIPMVTRLKIAYLYNPKKLLPIYSKEVLSYIIEKYEHWDNITKKNIVNVNCKILVRLIKYLDIGELYTANPEKTVIWLSYYMESLYKGDHQNLISFFDSYSNRDYGIHLIRDNWDDYNHKTLYRVSLNEWFSEQLIALWTTHIIWTDNTIRNTDKYEIKFPFSYIGEDFCSFANDERFYTELKETLWEKLSLMVLNGLNDLTIKDAWFIKKFEQLDAFSVSLLRDNSKDYINVCKRAFRWRIRNNSNPLANPYWRLKEEIVYPNWKRHRIIINLNFQEDKFWFFRINAIIGKNGIGKSTSLIKIAKLLSIFNTQEQGRSNYWIESWNVEELVTNDDEFADIPSEYEISHEKWLSGGDRIIFSPEESFLNNWTDIAYKHNFSKIIWISYEVFHVQAWWNFSFLRDSMNGVACSSSSLVEKIDEIKFNKSNYFKKKIEEIFSTENIDAINIVDILEDPKRLERLSSWYKVLLSTVIDLIIHIKPNSLILFDEPETHLHPEFVSILTRILYKLLDEFNSYMIIGTHSPVIIQQIPSKYITKMVNNWDRVSALPLEIESFWNSLTEIIYDVFGGEQEDVFYKNKIIELKIEWFSREEILTFFNNKLSLNMRLFLDTVYNEI